MYHLFFCNYSGTLKKILFFCYFQYFCAVKKMIIISRSEYEQMKQIVAEFQTKVRQLKEAIVLLKGGRYCYTVIYPTSSHIKKIIKTC